MKKLIAYFVLGIGFTVASAASAEILNVPGDFDEIDDAVQAAVPGDTVQVHSGTYTERTEILGATGVTIRGVDTGSGIPIIEPGDGEDGFRIAESTDLEITGFRFEGGARGISVSNASSNIEIVSNEFVRLQVAIRIRGGSGHIVLDNDIRNSEIGGGVRIRGAGNVQVDGNTLSSLAFDAIRVRRCDGVTITNNDIENATGDGIEVRDSANVVIGNIAMGGNSAVSNQENGIRVKSCTGVEVGENSTFDNLRYGIRVKRGGPIAAVADLVAAQNTAECNEFGDFRVADEIVTYDCTGTTTSTTTSTSTTSTSVTTTSTTLLGVRQ